MIETKWMDFLIEDDGLLEKYDTIWDKVSADILKTKRKYHEDEITDFFVKNIPRIGSDGNCSAVISLDFALKNIRVIICKCF